VNANNGAVIVKVNGLSASDATANTLVRRDSSGGAQFSDLVATTSFDAGMFAVDPLVGSTFEAGSSIAFNSTTYTYGTGAASAHRIALGAGTTGSALFGAATAAAARTTLGFDGMVPKIPIVFSNSSDFSTASTSFVDATGLSFSVLANKKYAMSVFLLTNKTDANGLAVQFTGPASPTKLFFRVFSSTVSVSGGSVADYLTSFSSPTSAINTVNGDGFSSINQALFSNGANAGTVQLQIRAVTGGTAKIYAGSHIIVTEL
jgi:hypothetical protein